MNFVFLKIVLPVVLAITTVTESRQVYKKVRRSVLSLPQGSYFSVTMDLIIPVVPLLNTTLTYLWFDLPLTFNVPTANDLNQLYVNFGLLPNTSAGTSGSSRFAHDLYHENVEEKRANHDRRLVYQFVEGFFQNFGFNGPACLKRSICELAETPLGSHGLFGKIFESLFLPTFSEFDPQFQQNLDVTKLPVELHFIGTLTEDDYLEAYLKGKKLVGCNMYFQACPISIFKILDF